LGAEGSAVPALRGSRSQEGEDGVKGCGCHEHSLGGKHPEKPSVDRDRVTYGTGKRALVSKALGEIHPVRHTAGGEWGFEIPSLPLSTRQQAVLAAAKSGGGGYKRRTTVPLRHQVADLRQRGLVPTAIADVLNLSDRRVNQILRELKTAA
jgi:hypothetical protein